MDCLEQMLYKIQNSDQRPPFFLEEPIKKSLLNIQKWKRSQITDTL
jgi:hypothetical protein